METNSSDDLVGDFLESWELRNHAKPWVSVAQWINHCLAKL